MPPCQLGIFPPVVPVYMSLCGSSVGIGGTGTGGGGGLFPGAGVRTTFGWAGVSTTLGGGDIGGGGCGGVGAAGGRLKAPRGSTAVCGVSVGAAELEVLVGQTGGEGLRFPGPRDHRPFGELAHPVQQRRPCAFRPEGAIEVPGRRPCATILPPQTLVKNSSHLRRARRWPTRRQPSS